MFESSKIELSRSALRSNIRFLKKVIGPNTIFSSVIKGNAYGHWLPLFVPLAEKCGVRHFSVFSAAEAHQALKSRTQDSHIMIMGDLDSEALAWAIEKELSFFVFDPERVKSAIQTSKKIGKPAKLHLELETGLNRTGLSSKQLRQVLEYLQKDPNQIQIEGVCSHLAGAENFGNYLRIQSQIENYQSQVSWLQKQPVMSQRPSFLRHTACSAAVINYPETILDMVRIGIAQYGFWPSKETEIHYFNFHKKVHSRAKRRSPLKRIIKWSSRIMSTKEVKRGDYVGYGSSGLVTRNLKLASVPIGYSHGFSRDLSHKGHVLVQGRRAPIVGMVNMSMFMIDVTDIPSVKRGDEVVLVGQQGDATISIGAFGELTRFINYEVLVSLPTEIPRVVVD